VGAFEVHVETFDGIIRLPFQEIVETATEGSALEREQGTEERGWGERGRRRTWEREQWERKREPESERGTERMVEGRQKKGESEETCSFSISLSSNRRLNSCTSCCSNESLCDQPKDFVSSSVHTLSFAVCR
jgi:hypothetical protein